MSVSKALFQLHSCFHGVTTARVTILISDRRQLVSRIYPKNLGNMPCCKVFRWWLIFGKPVGGEK